VRVKVNLRYKSKEGSKSVSGLVEPLLLLLVELVMPNLSHFCVVQKETL
jgi:hypothetical protein